MPQRRWKPKYKTYVIHLGKKKTITVKGGLERDTAIALKQQGIEFEYETRRIKYLIPATETTYTPDFILPNGIIIETKGQFDSKDRKKHLLVKEQHPDLDIRFVFWRANDPIYKGSKTTNAMWCEKHGFQWAQRKIPQEWIDEPGRGL